MPYRIDIDRPPLEALDILVRLGALDFAQSEQGVAAILPDAVTLDALTSALGHVHVSVSQAVARDDGSVWLLSPQSVGIGNVLIVPSEAVAPTAALRLADSTAFGSGHHPTTALCIEALEEILSTGHFDRILDVGTGSGILALTALMLGVPQAVGIDIDAEALEAAAENLRLNPFADRLHLIHGGPEVLDGRWPLVIANILAAPLIDMAPVLVRRLGKSGMLILSGIQSSLEAEVRHAYQHFGMRYLSCRTRAGWSVLMFQASW